MANALIFGVTGQTGSYLATNLVEANFVVFGFSRTESSSEMARLAALGIRESVNILTGSYETDHSLSNAIADADADVVFLLSGPSSVSESFLNPKRFFTEITNPALAILDFISREKPNVRFINVGSTDSYGFQRGVKIDEDSRFSPVSPYGLAKAATVEITRYYREEHRVFSSNAILTNHESPLRGPGFLSSRIISELRKVAEGSKSKAQFGDLSVVRDWLWAGDVSEALHKIAVQSEPSDFIVGSGESLSARSLVEKACSFLDLDPESSVEQVESLYRPNEIPSVSLNPQKIFAETGWMPTVNADELMEMLVCGHLRRQSRDPETK